MASVSLPPHQTADAAPGSADPPVPRHVEIAILRERLRRAERKAAEAVVLRARLAERRDARSPARPADDAGAVDDVEHDGRSEQPERSGGLGRGLGEIIDRNGRGEAPPQISRTDRSDTREPPAPTDEGAGAATDERVDPGPGPLTVEEELRLIRVEARNHADRAVARQRIIARQLFDLRADLSEVRSRIEARRDDPARALAGELSEVARAVGRTTSELAAHLDDRLAEQHRSLVRAVDARLAAERQALVEGIDDRFAELAARIAEIAGDGDPEPQFAPPHEPSDLVDDAPPELRRGEILHLHRRATDAQDDAPAGPPPGPGRPPVAAPDDLIT